MLHELRVEQRLQEGDERATFTQQLHFVAPAARCCLRALHFQDDIAMPVQLRCICDNSGTGALVCAVEEARFGACTALHE